MNSNKKVTPPRGGGQGFLFLPSIIDSRGLLRPEAPGTGIFHLTMPVRKIPPKRHSIAGAVPFPTLGRNVGFESTLERDFLLILRQGITNMAVIEQPVRLQLKNLGLGSGIFTPDFLIWTWNREGVSKVTLVEVKPEEVLQRDFQKLKPKLIGGIRFANRQGWDFRLITERHLRIPMTAEPFWPRIHTPVQRLCQTDGLLKRLLWRGAREMS